jgi:hypothetical protein
MSTGSVTRCLRQLQEGHPAAGDELWQRYFGRLVGLARRRLQGPLPLADEEDVAGSALASFFRGVAGGRFPDLADRDGLWRLLAVLTARKVAHLLRDEGRRERRQAGPAEGVEACSAGSPARTWRLLWPRATAACWTAWGTRRCKPWRFGGWKATRWRRSPLGCPARRARSSASWT